MQNYKSLRLQNFYLCKVEHRLLLANITLFIAKYFMSNRRKRTQLVMKKTRVYYQNIYLKVYGCPHHKEVTGSAWWSRGHHNVTRSAMVEQRSQLELCCCASRYLSPVCLARAFSWRCLHAVSLHSFFSLCSSCDSLSYSSFAMLSWPF